MKKVIALILMILTVVSFTACASTGTHDLANPDRASKYSDNYAKLTTEYGEAELKEDAEYGTVLTGVAVMRILEFSGDSKPELYIAYSDGTKPYANKQQIYGFDNGPYEFFNEYKENLDMAEITTKSSADKKGPCICLYTDEDGVAYLVVGEDLSKQADYYSYVTVDSNGDEIYNLVKIFTEYDGKQLPGKYEYIELTGLTKADAEKIFEENENVINSIESQKK